MIINFLNRLIYLFNNFDKKNDIINNYKKFNLDNFNIENIFDIINNFFIKIFFIINIINIFVVEIINTKSFKILILRCFFNIFFIANINIIIKHYRL